jgi:hypothetical protein
MADGLGRLCENHPQITQIKQQPLVFGLWSLVFGLWSLVFGFRFLVFDFGGQTSKT